MNMDTLTRKTENRENECNEHPQKSFAAKKKHSRWWEK